MPNQPTVQLGELCEGLDIRSRDVRYVLERGHVPAGVDEAPDSGNYRKFKPAQAFWLGMVLKLKAIGIKTPLAAKIADYAESSLRGVTQNLHWDWRFLPMAGEFDTEHQYFVEVGDLTYIRFLTDANPSGGDRLEAFGWHRVDRPGGPVSDVHPCAMVRLDLTQIAKLLASVFEKSPDTDRG